MDIPKQQQGFALFRECLALVGKRFGYISPKSGDWSAEVPLDSGFRHKDAKKIP